jgi:predicted transcriptional regulator
MSVGQTSLVAYHDEELQVRRKGIRNLVFSYVVTHPDCSQAEFCKAYKMQPHKVSGRFRELEQQGTIRKSGTKHEELCQGRLVSTYRLNIGPFVEVVE